MRLSSTFFIHPNQLYILHVCLSFHYVETDLESAPLSSSTFVYLANVNFVPLSYLWLLILPSLVESGGVGGYQEDVTPL